MKKLRVVDTIYSVVYREGVTSDEGHAAHGRMDADKCEIAIDVSGSSERRRWALVHELAHAVWEETGMGHEMAAACGSEKADLLEEDIVRRFVPELLRTLRDAKVLR